MVESRHLNTKSFLGPLAELYSGSKSWFIVLTSDDSLDGVSELAAGRASAPAGVSSSSSSLSASSESELQTQSPSGFLQYNNIPT